MIGFYALFSRASLFTLAFMCLMCQSASAGFKVSISTSDSGGPATAIVNDNNTPTNTGLYLDSYASAAKEISISSSNAGGNYNGVKFTIQTETNSPGGTTGEILSTTLSIKNEATGPRNIQFVVFSDDFNAPGITGDKLYYSTTLTSVGGFTPGSANADIYTRIDEVASQRTDNTFTLSGSTYTSPTKTFIRGSTYTIETVYNLTLSAGQTVQITSKSIVAAPAPSSAILALAALPIIALCGFARRRRQQLAPVTCSVA